MMNFTQRLAFVAFALQCNVAVSNENDIEAELKFVVEEINKNAPRKVDETTRLLGVEQQASRLIYHMEVFGGLAEGVTIDDFTKDTELHLKKEICKKPSMKYFAENGVKIVYSYLDYEGMPLSKITINTGLLLCTVN